MITPATTPGRDVVAYPTCAASRCTVTEALAEMDALGYDFHLFTHEIGRAHV